MQRWPIIFLILSSLLLSCCAYNKFANLDSYRGPKQANLTIDENNLKAVIPADGSSAKYKASIDVLNNHFTGIIVLKKTDEQTKHLVFVTELGMRMFDFEIRGDSIIPAFVFEPLNKPLLVNALVRNFKNILLIDWFNKNVELLKNKDKEVLHLSNKEQHLFLTRNENYFAAELNVFYKTKKESKTIYIGEYTKINLKQFGVVKLFIALEKIIE